MYDTKPPVSFGYLQFSFAALFMAAGILMSSQSNATEATELDLGTVDQLTIGTTTLLIKHPDDKTIEVYKNRGSEPLFRGEQSDFQAPAGLVKYRIKNSQGEAVLVELHNAGDIDETDYIVLIDQKGSGLQKILFGSKSITFGGNGAISRIQDSLRFERPAYPYQAGIWMEWSFEKGSRTGDIPFSPKDRRSLNAFFNSHGIKNMEPLDNAAFYHAVMTLPVGDRNRILASMSGLTNLKADSSGIVESDRYGLRKTPHLLAFSSCGIAYDGQMLNCFGNDSLAVWERKTGKFYFAVNFSREGSRYSRDDESLHFYPSIDKWSRLAKSQLDDWQSDAVWADE